MWCDWSNSAHVVRQDACSSRQLVNSEGTTGNAYGPICELRSRSTGFPTFCNASSRFLYAAAAVMRSSDDV